MGYKLDEFLKIKYARNKLLRLVNRGPFLNIGTNRNYPDRYFFKSMMGYLNMLNLARLNLLNQGNVMGYLSTLFPTVLYPLKKKKNTRPSIYIGNPTLRTKKVKNKLVSSPMNNRRMSNTKTTNINRVKTLNSQELSNAQIELLLQEVSNAAALLAAREMEIAKRAPLVLDIKPSTPMDLSSYNVGLPTVNSIPQVRSTPPVNSNPYNDLL